MTAHLSRRDWLAGAIGAASALAAPHARASGERRIVSVGGALTETLYALGAQAELVGVDTTSLYPDAARQLPSVGYARTLSAEGVLSLRPNMVVATAEAGPPAVLQQIESAQVPLALFDADHRFEGLLAQTQRLAELCGRVDAGRAFSTELRRAWARTRERLARHTAAGKPPVRVLFVLSHSMAQVRVSGSGTAADAMIRYAHGINVLNAVEGYKPLTPEAVIAAAPDVILVTEQGLEAAGGIDGLLRAPGLAQTPAGRARRVVAQEAMLMLGFGPRLPQAVAALAEALHGKPA